MSRRIVLSWIWTLVGAPAALAQTTPLPSAQPAPPTVGNTAPAPVNLSKIVDAVKQAYNKQEQPVIVFDIDGTLFDSRPRMLQILKEYGEQELRTVRPLDADKLATLALPNIMPSITETMQRLGITEDAVISNAEVFRADRFNTDDYVKYDQPVAGTVKFVRELYTAGARIAYLTDRDVGRQLLGTVKALRDYGFPVGIQASELMMRPTMQTQDAVFKQKTVLFLRGYGKVIATFGVEPANANFYRRAFPEATVIVVDGPHSPNAPQLWPNIQTLDRFE